jgi:signal transduction histidine kinase
MLTTARGINIHQHAEVRPPESHHGTAISLIDRPAGSGERRLVFLITLVMLLTFAAVVPFVNTPLSNSAAFVPTTSAAVLINDFITSVLLYSQGSIFPSRSLLLLASGYLFTALIIALHALTFPGAVTPAGLFDASLQTSPWLFFIAHLVFPIILLGYARMKGTDRANPLGPSSVRAATVISVATVLVLTCGVALVTIAGSELLPTLLIDKTHAIRIHLAIINVSIIGLTTAALIELWIRRRTLLDYCLMLICVAIILEEASFSLSGVRYTVGYYAGRLFWLLTSVVVLALLLQEAMKLFARLERSYALLKRERDNKLLNARAITASIAHEVKQPLTAIIAISGATLEYLKRVPPDNDKAQNALHRIMAEGHRAGDVVEGIRALFGRADQKLEPVDLNWVVENVLDSLHGELLDRGVTILSEFAELPRVEGRRDQLQQVVFNLVHNALEAMQTAPNRQRLLQVKTECRGAAAVALVLEDSGSGIDPTQLESIFQPFVTTKSQGMGLGLAICREIVEQHGGQLVASSDGATGAEFQVILPVGPRDNTATQS